MLVMKFTETSLICNLLLKAVSVSAETAVYAYITDALAERPWLPKKTIPPAMFNYNQKKGKLNPSEILGF